MKAHELLLSSGVMLGLLFAAPMAVAQDDGDDVLEEIVVTATRIETDLMSTSIAVSAFTQEQLTRDGVRDIRDASDLVPNFDVAFSPSDSGVQMTMRGINSNNFTEIGDPSVAFHVDGVYSPRPQGAVALMFDLERLEIMRGPQGTLFGRNSAAGSVNVITAKPTTEGVYATIGAELGNRNQRNLLGTLNMPITDTFALRGNFFIEQRDGFADQDTGNKDLEGIGNQGPDGIPDMDQRRNRAVSKSDYYGNSDRWAVRLAGMWTPSDRFDWMVSVETAQDNSAGWPIAPNCEANPELCQYNGGGIDYIDPNIPGYLDMKMDAVRSHANYALTDNIDLVYNFGWGRQQRSQEWDGDMGWRPVPGPTTGWLNRNQPWDSLYLATAESHYESFSHELQLQGVTGPVNWIAGFFDFREDNDIIFDVEQPFCCSTGALGGISFVQPERILESQAIFGQATWHISDRWHLTLGYRYTEDLRQDIGGRNIGCFGGTNCSFSMGLIPFDGHPQTPGETDELLLPQFTSADLIAGMGAQDRLNNYEVFDVNDNRETFDNGNWRIGLDYDLNTDTFLYFYTATGSKAGSFGDGVDICRCGRIEIFKFEPEEVLNYELGYKSTLLNGKLNLTVAAFFTEFTNKQVSQFRTVGFVEDPPGTILQPPQEIGTLVTSNAGEAEIKGLEVEWDWIPWDDGRLTGGIGLLDAKFLSWPGYAGEAYFCDQRADAGPEFECVPQDDGSGSVDIEGNELPYSTPVSFTLAYQHDFHLGNGALLRPYAKFHWEDDMHMTEGNFDAIPSLSDKRESFGILDLTLRYEAPENHWAVEAFVYNATDERFQTYWVDSNQPDAPLFTWNAPRTWGVRATYNVRP
jgi:iron complex outermembrane receptor protein